MSDSIISLDMANPVWEHFFTVNPLVVIGSRNDEEFNLAPKHMAMQMGWENYFGFVCTPKHQTYHNIKKHKEFTVSYPKPSQTVITSLASCGRCGEKGDKPIIECLETIPAKTVKGVFLKDAYVFFECELQQIVDGFGVNSLIIGKIVAAHVDQICLRVSEGDDQEMLYKAPLLTYLNPRRFASIQETYAFPFPADFKL